MPDDERVRRLLLELLLEPIAQIIARPSEPANQSLVNEDAQSLVFDDTNLFQWSKYSGYDRFEGGLRANYGAQYITEYEKAFKAVAKHYRAYYVPFLLEGVAGRRELILDDNLHPTAAAQSIILENVWRELLPALNKS